MPDLLAQPPPPAAIAKMQAIPGVRLVPGVLACQDGPDRHLGPEAAGALLMLQATFVDEERAARFWDAAAGLMEQLAEAPGFIRRFSFADGPLMTLLALWRTKADAEAFFSSERHQQAMQDLYAGRWQYSHFAALWEMASPRQRVIFCQECDGVTPAAAGTCRGCGSALWDPYAATVATG
ncbi:MAG: antibiotic biosynthesis monooxygenase [Actinomycetota bacterium]|nr:antibiotic biosynthesis monooxygenase [Actinomycetota bacterium]